MRFQDGQGNTFTREPADLIEEFNLEGDFNLGPDLTASTYDAVTKDPSTLDATEAAKMGGIPEGFSTTPPAGMSYTAIPPKEGMMFVYGPGGERKEVPVGSTRDVKMAQAEGPTLTKEATAAERDTEQEEAALGTAAEFEGDVNLDYLKRVFEDTTGFKAKIGNDGKIRFQDGQGNTFTRDPADLVSQFKLEGDFKLDKDYAEGVTTEDRTTIDLEKIKLDKEDITTSIGEEISPEEITKLREIAKGRGIDIQELRDESPELFEQAKERDAQTGTAQTGIAAQVGEPRDITIEEARDEYRETPQGKNLLDSAEKEIADAGVERDAILEELKAITTPERRQVLQEQLVAVSAKITKITEDVTAKFQEEAERYKTNARDGTAPEAVAAKAKYSEMDEVAAGAEKTIDTLGDAGAASREGVTGTAVAAPDAAEMDREQAAVKERLTHATEDIDDAVAKTTDIETMPAFERISKREAQTGEAATRIGEQLVGVPSEDLEGREAILGEPPKGDAAHIYGVPTLAAATMQAVSANERKMAAADMLEVVAELPPEITAAVIESPTEVQAKLDTDPDPKVAMALTAMPQEALVSVQMEGLLAGMEGGETPLWARPAVAQVEQMMAQRGLSVSTVGRDALFNAIIQSAMPIAQSNAQALQQHASQKLSNEQQSGVEESKQIMQVRMQNLSNRQVAASQTVQMANDIKAQQGTLDQQAIITKAQQGQEARMATGQFAQQRRQQESAQRQQAAVEILSAEQQTEFENLKAESFRSGKQMDADQQVQLAEYQEKVNRRMRQAELQNDMEKAELSGEIQIELAHISELNAAEKDKMTVANQDRLTKLTTLMDFKKTNVQLAQQMSLASLSNEQQIRMAELAEKAAADSANFSTDNQYELMRLQNYTKFMSENTEILQQTELANFSMEEKFALADLSSGVPLTFLFPYLSAKVLNRV